MGPLTSAGILLFRFVEGAPQVLLVHPGGPYWTKKDEGAWSIPKGECEEGEQPLDAALRELSEELGPTVPALELKTLVELGTVRQKGGKLVHGWAAEAEFDPEALESISFEMEWPPRSGLQREFPEVDRAEWLDPETAKQKINPAQVAFIDRLLERIGSRD
jgi:predicted NUDIX family NTP pyrophosphohydrolase